MQLLLPHLLLPRPSAGADHPLQRPQYLRHAPAGNTGQQHDRTSGCLRQCCFPCRRLARGHGIGLVQPDQLRLVGQTAPIGRQLLAHRFPRPHHIARRAIHQMQQHRTPLDMPEDPRAEPSSLMRALDQPGDIRQHELLGGRQPHHAQLRMQRGERIVRDLRPRRRNRRQERGFAGIRQPDQPDIGDQFQAQPNRAFLARPALVGPPRCPVGRGLVVRIAEPAVATAQQQHALPGRIQIGQHRLVVVGDDLRADRHLDHHRRRACPGLVGPGAIAALLRPKVLRVAEIDQRVQVLHRLEHDVAALAAVAAIWATKRDVLLAAECDHAVAAVTGAQMDFRFVEKLHRFWSQRGPDQVRP